MPLPAHQLLHPACPIKPAWAVFNSPWYLHRHADARALCQGKPPEAALLYYLRVGAGIGHSPSPIFDETWYLARHPDVTERVRAGNYTSGFDHFCQHGHRAVSPHWLFDDELYANLYEDMTLENLDRHQCFGRYDHYLKAGQRECRMGQFLFDSAFYRARAIEAGIPAAEIDGQGPYVHFLSRLGTDVEELAPSIYFDPCWYVERHPAAKADITRGRYTSAIHHYLKSQAPEYLDPVPEFSEQFYRRRYPDIAAAIEAGLYRSGYQQFVQYGAFELRQPRADIDLVFYHEIHERVRNDLNTGEVRDAFAHLRQIGLAERLAYCALNSNAVIREADTRGLFLQRARDQLVVFARRKIDFSFVGVPEVAVIMVLFNRFELTMLALSSLRDCFPGTIELILIDNASTDETMWIARYVSGAKRSRNASNIGFLRACNQALEHVTSPLLLFLNNDVELAHGAVAAALTRVRSAVDIGAVGAKIIRTNGALQEAGSIIWNEGTTVGYMRDASPLAAEANFVRDVDYCSAAFLLCRTDLVRRLAGFDEAYALAYLEDADLCVRMIEAGYRIVYDPCVVLTHFEFGSAPTTEASMVAMSRGKRLFKKKRKKFLKTKLAPSPISQVEARSLSTRKLVLFIEDTIPLRRLGSGFVRSNDVVRAIVAAGYDVHVFPVNGTEQDAGSLFGDFPETVEILHDRDFVGMLAFLEERSKLYDLIWVARTHNLVRVLPLLRKAGIDPALVPVVLDTEAVASARDAVRLGGSFDLAAALRAEFDAAGACRTILAVSEKEAEILRGIGLANVARLGTARRPAPTPSTFAARTGFLFVAGIHHEDSPSLDSLRWYRDEVQPALAALLGEAPILHIAGYTARDIDLSGFAGNPRMKFHGAIDDLTPLYNAARLFIAPTRFAAGTPYKVYEAASFGVPCVTTDLLAGQLGWEDGADLLAAPVTDAYGFAAQIARLYQSESLWNKLRQNALARLESENGFEEFENKIKVVIGGLLGPNPV